MAQLREAEKVRKQQAMQELQKTFMELSGREFEAGEAEKERDWRTGERTGSQEYGTGERLGTQEYETGEREAERAWSEEKLFPHEVVRAKAGRAAQWIGGDASKWAEEMRAAYQAFQENYWAQYAPKDELGNITDTTIPEDAYEAFREELLAYGIPESQVDAFIKARQRAQATQKQQPPPAASGGTHTIDETGNLSSSLRGLTNRMKELSKHPQMNYADHKIIADWIDQILTNPKEYETNEQLYQKRLKEVQAMAQKYANTGTFGLQPLSGF